MRDIWSQKGVHWKFEPGGEANQEGGKWSEIWRKSRRWLSEKL